MDGEALHNKQTELTRIICEGTSIDCRNAVRDRHTGQVRSVPERPIPDFLDRERNGHIPAGTFVLGQGILHNDEILLVFHDEFLPKSLAVQSCYFKK